MAFWDSERRKKICALFTYRNRYCFSKRRHLPSTGRKPRSSFCLVNNRRTSTTLQTTSWSFAYLSFFNGHWINNGTSPPPFFDILHVHSSSLIFPCIWQRNLQYLSDIYVLLPSFFHWKHFVPQSNLLLEVKITCSKAKERSQVSQLIKLHPSHC